MLYIVLFGIGIIAGCGVCYLLCKKAINETREYNLAIEEANRQEEERQKKLAEKAACIESNIQLLKLDEQQYIGKINGLTASIKSAEEQAKTAADTFYTQNMQFAEERLERGLKEESAKYQQAIQDFQESLKICQLESTESFNQNLAEIQEAILMAQLTLDDMTAKVAAAVEASKRAEEMLSERDFYRIKLSDIDIEEIEKLRSVEPYLRDKEPLNKVIWKVYYEKPTNDLIGRVVGTGVHTGIYKITHIESQKCYIGQAVLIGR